MSLSPDRRGDGDGDAQRGLTTAEHVRLHSQSESGIEVVLMSLLNDIAVGRNASVRVTAAEGVRDEAGCWHVLVNLTVTHQEDLKEG